MKQGIIDQLTIELKKSIKTRNTARIVYYQQAIDKSIAVVSFERFKGSWAGEEWLKRNVNAINEIRDSNNRRFGWNGMWSLTLHQR
jgi:hypothetical protein